MKICVFGSSCEPKLQKYYRDAFALGALIAKSGSDMVFGAGVTGLMGEVSRGAHCESGKIIGIVPEKLNLPGVVTPLCTELIVTKTMDERKSSMIALSDAFIALPGGYGTFDELFYVMALKQLEYIDAPIAVLNTLGYFAPLLSQFDAAIESGFLDERYRSLVFRADTPEAALSYVMNAQGNAKS